MKRILFLFLLLSLTVAGLRAQQEERAAQQILEQRGEVYFSFIPKPFNSLEQISGIISIDRINADGRVYAYANAREFNRFQGLKLSWRLEQETLLPLQGLMAPSMAAFMQSWNIYPTYDQYDSLMHKLATDYPSICRYHEIGNTPGGHKIMLLQLGDNVAQHEKEPRLLYTSSMHGDELTGYVLMLRLAHYLLSNYGQDARVDSLMNNVEIWINPLANPDGAYYTADSTVISAKRYNYNFVDLNRNYPDPYAGQHPYGNSWQPETQYFMALADSLEFNVSANFHGGAEVMNYPWDCWSKLPADVDWWLYVCRQYADSAQANGPQNYFTVPSGTGVINGYQWYPIFGGRQDFMNYFQHCREVTVELSGAKMPAVNDLPIFWNANFVSLMNYMEQARYGLRGVITDSISGKPLKARVFITGHDQDSSHVWSRQSGGDYYRYLDSGFYDITYWAPHYKAKTISNVHIQRDSSTVVNVALAKDYTAMGELPQFDFLLYPNPVQDVLFIHSAKEVQYARLYSLEGRELKQWNLNSAKEFQLKAGDFPAGIYFLELISREGERAVRRIVLHE
jgi:hypothetical protein